MTTIMIIIIWIFETSLHLLIFNPALFLGEKEKIIDQSGVSTVPYSDWLIIILKMPRCGNAESDIGAATLDFRSNYRTWNVQLYEIYIEDLYTVYNEICDTLHTFKVKHELNELCAI